MIIQNFVSGLVLLCGGIIRLTGANNGFVFVYNKSPSHTIELMAIYPNFTVKSYKFGDSEWTNRDEAQNPIVITNFFACTQYELVAMVTSETGLQEFLHKETLITGCGESVPIKFVNISSESNSIKITLDFKHIDCVDSFYVMINSSRRIYYSKHNLTKVLTLSELIPCSTYHMYILVNVHFPFTIFDDNFRTSPPELRPIENINYDKTTGLLVWSPVILNDCSLSSHYVISIEPDVEHSKNGLIFYRESAKNEFDLNFLGGCSKFLVSIKPKGHDDLIGTERIRTGYRTPGPVVKLNMPEKHVYEPGLLIEWDSPTVNPACVTQYSVEINNVLINTLSGSVNRLSVPHCTTCELYITVCIVENIEEIIRLKNCVHYQFDSKLKKIIFIAVMCLTMVTLFGGLLFYVLIRCKKIPESPGHTYIEVKQFPKFYNSIECDFIADEYQIINDLDLSTMSKINSNNQGLKNQHTNITPYDFNRVILTLNEYCTADYINASYIDGYNKKKRYIATQGPTEDTVYEFWHMVVEQKCDRIIMLTGLSENGITQCYQYFPIMCNNEKIFKINDITIRNIEETNLENFIKRVFIISSKGLAERRIVQYQLNTWLSRDLYDSKIVINFINYINRDSSKSLNPTIVHCTAGVGRTGTFIALEIILHSCRHEKYISIFDTVKKLRLQRDKMVQIVGEYTFLYDTLNLYLCKYNDSMSNHN